MAREFINEDFLLQTETAGYLYHEHAQKMPIYDYHCRLQLERLQQPIEAVQPDELHGRVAKPPKKGSRPAGIAEMVGP